MVRFHKLSRFAQAEEVAHSYPPTYAFERMANGADRLVAAVPGGDAEVLSRLASCLAGPYGVLYLLHTPRTNARPGRYQSPALSKQQLSAFLERFADYLGGDARHDLWVHSPEERGTLVWDRHDLIFAYGPAPGAAAQLTCAPSSASPRARNVVAP